ncbi:MAG: hypothetical protein LBC20_16095 [Planctomycetaceae bacterium]|nr:hypothetical protein [Planctomycetaceae bacterium]
MFHFYAAMLIADQTVIAVKCFGSPPTRLLFECCLDAVNQVKRKRCYGVDS